MKHIGYLSFNSTFWGQGEKTFCINQYLLKVSKLMNKDLAKNNVGNYFNIGNAKTLVKFKEN